jgi:transposase
MQATTTIGLDIAKSVFQVHGIDAAGNVILRRQALLRPDVFPKTATLPGRHRSMRFIALLVARTRRAWPYGALDAGGLREALRQATQE